MTTPTTKTISDAAEWRRLGGNSRTTEIVSLKGAAIHAKPGPGVREACTAYETRVADTAAARASLPAKPTADPFTRSAAPPVIPAPPPPPPAARSVSSADEDIREFGRSIGMFLQTERSPEAPEVKLAREVEEARAVAVEKRRDADLFEHEAWIARREAEGATFERVRFDHAQNRTPTAADFRDFNFVEDDR